MFTLGTYFPVVVLVCFSNMSVCIMFFLHFNLRLSCLPFSSSLWLLVECFILCIPGIQYGLRESCVFINIDVKCYVNVIISQKKNDNKIFCSLIECKEKMQHSSV